MPLVEVIPERLRTPAMARAITSPGGILLAGAGTAVAIVGGAPLAAAAVVGGLCWLGRLAFALPRRAPGERIDAFAIGDPWRRMVIDAQQAQTRFRQAVERSKVGPLRERLSDLGSRLDEAVQECWRIASQGDSLDAAVGQLRVKEVQQELVEAHAERKRDGKSASLDRTIEALESQLASAQRILDVARQATDRLRVLNAQLDESVARAIELSVQAADSSALDPLAADVDTLVGDLEALRQGMEESGGASRAARG